MEASQGDRWLPRLPPGVGAVLRTRSLAGGLLVMKLTGRTEDDVRAFADGLWDWSIPRLLLDRARTEPDAPAVRYKRRGLYDELSWSQYLDRAGAVALGLRELGLKAGDRVAIMADPCVEWALADLGIIGAGGISCGIYPTCSAEQVGDQVARIGTRFFIAEDQEHLDKLLGAGDMADGVEVIVLVDDRTRFLYSDPRIITFDELTEMGRAQAQEHPELVDDSFESVEADAIAVMTFTSGTTGAPKAAMHTHRDVLVGMTFPYLYLFAELRASCHRTVMYLPLAHLVERAMSVWLPLISDCVPHIGEKREGLRTCLAEVQPTFLHGVPRIWEKLAAQVSVAVSTAPRLHRRAFDVAVRVGGGWVNCVWNDVQPSIFRRLAQVVSRRLVFRPALHKVGLAELRGAFTGGAPIPPRVQGLWQAWGVPLRNLYGITEGTTIGAQTQLWAKPDGPWTTTYPKEVSLGPDGEVLVRGRGLFQRYWQDPEATAATLVDGQLHTGDIAVAEEGGFRLVDRKKDVMITLGGKNLSPAMIENALKASPYVSEVILVADSRRYPTCLIEIDFDTVAQWARARRLTYAGYVDLTQHPDVVELISQEVSKANGRLARVEQVKAFRIIPKELDPEEGDTTPTRKVKRFHAYELFHDLIEEMYSGDFTGEPGLPRGAEGSVTRAM